MDQYEVDRFTSIMNDNAEKYGFGILIDSVHEYDYTCDRFEPIVYDPIFMHLDNFQPRIHAAQTTKTKTVSTEFLSKIQKIDNEKANKVLDHNKQLNLQGYDNDLSCQLLTNDHMIHKKSVIYWYILRYNEREVHSW